MRGNSSDLFFTVLSNLRNLTTYNIAVSAVTNSNTDRSNLERLLTRLLNFFTRRRNRSTTRQSYMIPWLATYCEAMCHIQWCFGSKYSLPLLSTVAAVYAS